MERPDWDKYFLGIARAVAARADCTRRKVGAVVVDDDHRIIASGYNGSYPGGPSCLKGECPRGRHYLAPGSHWDDGCETGCHEAECLGCGGKQYCGPGDCGNNLCICGRPWPCKGVCGGCGEAWPCKDAAAPMSSYDTGPGACISIHAEANALLFARTSVKGMTLYCTDDPCDGCLKLIRGAGITRIVTGAVPVKVIDI